MPAGLARAGQRGEGRWTARVCVCYRLVAQARAGWWPGTAFMVATSASSPPPACRPVRTGVRSPRQGPPLCSTMRSVDIERPFVTGDARFISQVTQSERASESTQDVAHVVRSTNIIYKNESRLRLTYTGTNVNGGRVRGTMPYPDEDNILRRYLTGHLTGHFVELTEPWSLPCLSRGPCPGTETLAATRVATSTRLQPSSELHIMPILWQPGRLIWRRAAGSACAFACCVRACV